MPLTSKFWFIIKAILYLTIADGIARSDLMKADTTLSQPKVGVAFVVAAIIILFVSWWVLSMVEHMMSYPVRCTIGILIGIGLMVSCTTALVEDSNFVRYGISAYYGIGAICQLGLLFGSKFVKNFYFIHDLVCGRIILGLGYRLMLEDLKGSSYSSGSGNKKSQRTRTSLSQNWQCTEVILIG